MEFCHGGGGKGGELVLENKASWKGELLCWWSPSPVLVWLAFDSMPLHVANGGCNIKGTYLNILHRRYERGQERQGLCLCLRLVHLSDCGWFAFKSMEGCFGKGSAEVVWSGGEFLLWSDWPLNPSTHICILPRLCSLTCEWTTDLRRCTEV